MRIIGRGLVLSFLILLFNQQLFANIVPISLEERVTKSEQVILAKAISAVSYWNEEHTGIYTAYTMEVGAYLTDVAAAYTFDLILPGGEVDGELEVVWPNAHISIGEEYLILAKNATPKKLSSQNNNARSRIPKLQPFAFIQGVIPFLDEEYTDFFIEEAMDETTLFEKIKKITKKEAKTPRGKKYNPRKKKKDKDKDGVSKKFDCDDKNPNLPLPVGAACDDGNPETSNDQIQADGCSCAGNSQAAIIYENCGPNDLDLPVLPGTPCDDGDSTTIRDIILIDGCSCLGVFSDVKKTRNNNKQDDLLSGSGSFRPASITLKNGNGNINPIFPAGTIQPENDLLIEGTGFGNTRGMVQFSNSDSGGRTAINTDNPTDIISWTDTKIRVKIPTKAGSGQVNIVNSNGAIVATSAINIAYSINSIYSTFRSFAEKTRQQVKLTNRNQAGGYTILLNTPSGITASETVMPFERAMNTWICNSGVNWQLDKTGTDVGFANDGNCVVLFDQNLPTGTLAITTSRYKATGNSVCSGHETVWYLKEFDIQVLPQEKMQTNYSWNFGIDAPTLSQFDFETIILHELGHAHGLGHVNQEGEVMHYSVQNGVLKRTISAHAHEGSKHKMANSTQANCISTHQPMISLAPSSCFPEENMPNTSARIKVMLEGFYDPAKNNLTTSLVHNTLLPAIHPFGQMISDATPSQPIANFPPNVVDWIRIELRDEADMQKVVAQMAVFVKSDGQVVDITGNELISFEGLTNSHYYIAIHHKSHLPIISNLPQALNGAPQLYDFSASQNSTMGNDQQKLINGQYFMTTGDFDGNGLINSLDFNLWKQQNAAVNAYSPADADGNGIINNQDYNLWKANGSKVSVLNQ